MEEILNTEQILELCEKHQLIERQRKLDIVRLVNSLVLSSGSDDSGRLADALRRYNMENGSPVVRGAFYKWIDEKLSSLLQDLLDISISQVKQHPVVLSGPLATVSDWLIIDSETVTLRKSTHLKECYPATHDGAGLKVHKEYSVGRGSLEDYRLSPAREHDAKRFEVGEKYRGKGILIDLGYASLETIRGCELYDVSYVMRLKENWQPQMTRLSEGELTREFFDGMNFRFGLEVGWLELNGNPIDAEVTLGQGKKKVRARLVGVFVENEYHFYLTNLPRETHSPQVICDIYRIRWDIEIDNKLDKSGSRLDQIRAERVCSAQVLIYAGLLHSLLVNLLVYMDRVAQMKEMEQKQGPLHKLLVSQVLRTAFESLTQLLMSCKPCHERWDVIAASINTPGRDPNWRSRPSVLDRMLGLCAPPGRARRKKLKECPPSARAYRNTRSKGKAA